MATQVGKDELIKRFLSMADRSDEAELRTYLKERSKFVGDSEEELLKHMIGYMDERAEIRRCPFCGGKFWMIDNEETNASPYWKAQCMECFCELDSEISREDLIAKLNRRA